MCLFCFFLSLHFFFSIHEYVCNIFLCRHRRARRRQASGFAFSHTLIMYNMTMIIKFYLFPFVICRRVTSPKTYMRGVGRGGAEQCEIVRRTFASRRIYFICGTAILLMRAHTHTPHSKSLSTSSLSGDFYSARRTAKKITLIQGIFSFFMSTIVLSPPLRARARYNMKRTICVRKGGGR